MKNFGLSAVLFLCLGLASTVLAQDQSNTTFGYVSLQGDYDTRDFNTLTVNIRAKIPYRFEYFSFVNFQSPIDTNTNFETTGYFTEQHLRWAPLATWPVDLTTHLALTTGGSNDVLRPAIRWRVGDTPWLSQFFKKMNLIYNLNYTPYAIELQSTPGWNMQLEHFYNWNIFAETLNNRVYLSGFADHNIHFDGDNHSSAWVTEHQLGVRMINWLYAVAEFRYNEYLVGREEGLGVGLEYRLMFK